MDDIVCRKLKLEERPADMTEWKALVDRIAKINQSVRIALVGKYVQLHDAYLSVIESLSHAGFYHDVEIHIDWVDAETLTADNLAEKLSAADGILVPGGFGERGIEGKILAIQYARENKVPFMGICLGMQMAAVEFARHVIGWEDANSAEFDKQTPHNIIDLMLDQKDVEDMGGTQRLGQYPCRLVEGTLARELYGCEEVGERHRHRYEFNNDFREIFANNGMVFSGLSPDGKLVEIIELPEHPFFIASQFHPEFVSRPNRPQSIFKGFIGAAKTYSEAKK
mgnify:FL=1